MQVHDLNKNQLEQLKCNYFYQLMETDPEVLDNITFYQDIPDSIIFEHYSGIEFVPDDFFD